MSALTLNGVVEEYTREEMRKKMSGVMGEMAEEYFCGDGCGEGEVVVRWGEGKGRVGFPEGVKMVFVAR